MQTTSPFQESSHGAGHDYVVGSPHLRHAGLRQMVVAALTDEVEAIRDRQGRCRALEIGAGHGTFTAALLAAGAEVEVTEMSGPSAEVLADRFAAEPDVSVRYDPDGSAAAQGQPVDLVAYISVLHHIPDYVGALEQVLTRVSPGGALVSFQDPLWYPRRGRVDRLLDRGAYLAWRIPHGDLRQGFSSTYRRMRGRLDPTNPSDMVEYHVVRDGVDEMAVSHLLEQSFASVDIIRYWSTQSPWLQALGGTAFPANTFGVTARNRQEEPGAHDNH